MLKRSLDRVLDRRPPAVNVLPPWRDERSRFLRHRTKARIGDCDCAGPSASKFPTSGGRDAIRIVGPKQASSGCHRVRITPRDIATASLSHPMLTPNRTVRPRAYCRKLRRGSVNSACSSRDRERKGLIKIKRVIRRQRVNLGFAYPTQRIAKDAGIVVIHAKILFPGKASIVKEEAFAHGSNCKDLQHQRN